MTVTIDQQKPTGSYEALDVSIAFHCDEGSGVDSDTITLTLTDPQGTAHTPISLGAFDTTNGWNGYVKADGTGYDVVVAAHDPLMGGQWSATATADSLAGGEDGSLTWTFDVLDVVGNILYLIIDLLEGQQGTGRSIPENYFEHIPFDEDALGPGGAAGETRKFVVGVVGHADDGSIPAFVSGDYVQSAQMIRITVLYDVEPQAYLRQEVDIARDDKLIRRTLEWPENWCLTSGWTGAEIAAMTREQIGEDESPQVIAVSYDLQVSIREKHG